MPGEGKPIAHIAPAKPEAIGSIGKGNCRPGCRHARISACFAEKPAEAIPLDLGIVVQKQNPVGAGVEGLGYSEIHGAGKADVFVQLDDPRGGWCRGPHTRHVLSQAPVLDANQDIWSRNHRRQADQSPESVVGPAPIDDYGGRLDHPKEPSLKSVAGCRFPFNVHFSHEPGDLRRQAFGERVSTPRVTADGYSQPASTNRDVVVEPDQLLEVRYECSKAASLRVRFWGDELEALNGFVMRPKHMAMHDHALGREDRMPDSILASSASESFEARA
jgi:hypothetical protein